MYGTVKFLFARFLRTISLSWAFGDGAIQESCERLAWNGASSVDFLARVAALVDASDVSSALPLECTTPE